MPTLHIGSPGKSLLKIIAQQHSLISKNCELKPRGSSRTESCHHYVCKRLGSCSDNHI